MPHKHFSQAIKRFGASIGGVCAFLATRKVLFQSNIIDALSGCLVPLLPAVIAAGMIKTIAALLGPTLLNVLPETSDTYVILSIVGDAGFYFLPVFCGYSAAKKFNTNILISMLICSVLVHPQLIDIVESGEAFSVFGVPMTPVSYSSNILAPVLIVFVQSYVEKLFQRISPQLFAMIIVPVCTTLVMIPLALCVLGPLGTWIGDVLAIAVTTIHDILGPIAVAFVAAAFMVMVVTGAHITLSTFCITQLLTLGYEEIIFPASTAASFALTAAALAYAIKSKEKKEKSLGFSCAVSNFFGSASEPTIFGIFMPHKRIWGCQMIGALAGGLYLGMTNVAYYALNPHILIFLSFTGGGFANTVNGMIGLAISFVVTFLLVFFFGGTTKKERIIK